MNLRLWSVSKYLLLSLIAVFLIYATLNSLTLFFWGDPSLRGEPRLFHPPQIVILHYASLISPAFGKFVLSLFFIVFGIGIIAYFGFRQITAKNSLHHPVRECIVQHICEHPGRHFSTLMRETGINRGTLYYHLWQLKTLGMVTVVKDGGLTRYYLHLEGIDPLSRKLMNHRDNPVRNRILGFLAADAVCSREDFIRELGVSGPLLWYHMQLLARDGIVLVEKKKGRTRYILSMDASAILGPGALEFPVVAKSSRLPGKLPKADVDLNKTIGDTKARV